MAAAAAAAAADVKREVISTANAPAAIGPYSQAIRAGNTLYVSGCIGLDPKTMDFTGDKRVEAQTTQTLENLKAVVEAGGSSLPNVLKTTILLTTMDHFAVVNGIYAKYFPSAPPARATFAVAGLPKSALIEIECVALVPSTAPAAPVKPSAL